MSDHDLAAERRRGGMSARQWVAIAILVPLVAIGAFVASRALGGDDGPPGLQIGAAGDDVSEFDWDYVIPPGTADRINRGETVEIVPGELTVEVGDTIRIVNDDIVDHVVGVFYVRAGSTLTQRFQSAGVLEGTCSVHSSGAFVLNVVEP